MASNHKPIPALYTVYILRSTVRHASLYIGSTPNPPRRLKQHNGDAPGGAARTSRASLRPWEMVGLISGFPGMVAALKFEWALANPHLSMHIPAGSRISISTGRKRNGMPKRPPISLTSMMSNVHLLLGVPSFERWPLKLHFFAPDVYKAWNKWLASNGASLREHIEVVTDFEPIQARPAAESGTALADAGDAGADAGAGKAKTTMRPWGIHALPLDYTAAKDYVVKGRSVFEFEREGNCVVCHEPQEAGKGLLALCTNVGCEGVGHLSCWSRHLLGAQGTSEILPVKGSCPSCGGEVRWGDMMKELTLRTRGEKEVDKLLKPPRRRAKPDASD